MSLRYFKRYRMEVDLNRLAFEPAELPKGYLLLPWRESLLEAHAETKYRSFRMELDAHVFPCLGDLNGCLQLMGEIAGRDGFLQEATWLMQYRRLDGSVPEFCGTIQGIRDRRGFGAVQNLGVIPEHRGRGLGACLLGRALAGFRQAGLRRACLEVTADNSGALRLYGRLGFRTVKTVYKAAEVAYA